MYCSACGQALIPGQPLCPQCGRPTAAQMPPVPNLGFQLQTYASRIRALGTVWLIYGGLSLALGILGLGFAGAFFHGFGPWAHGPWFLGGPGFFGHGLLRFALGFTVVRCALMFLAGWGLLERSEWGRVVAIVAAFFSLLHIPLGTALGVWTLVTLLGYRNTTLYNQL